MIPVLAEAERNTNSAAEESSNYKKYKMKEGVVVVELDQFKYTLGNYAQPLTELRDSL